jgi:protein-disulfide isomerase
LVGLAILVLPVLSVQFFRQTRWGPFWATPEARQIGSPKARVLIVEYSDFQCPMCARIQPTIHQILDNYQGKVRFIFKFFPLTRIHKNSRPAAEAAECASRQKKFWPFHDQLFQTQGQWENLASPATSFLAIAVHSQLDLPAFASCLKDPTVAAAIENDLREGQNREIQATPTFFVGEERLVGNVFVTDAARTIERALRQ